MLNWVLKGLKTGIVSTSYPDRDETAPGVSPGLPSGKNESGGAAGALVDRCLTGALILGDSEVQVDTTRCVHCFRCIRGTESPLDWQDGYEWAASAAAAREAGWKTGNEFSRSLHIRVIDAGACGACLSEIEQLNKPYYNMHRLGFFLTPTPREADVLLVAGPVTDHMRMALRKTYEAMPTPKGVIAVGACALSGGVFGPSFASGSGVQDVLPVDIVIPGCPPPPLAILHGLLLMVSRKEVSVVTSLKSQAGGRRRG